MMGIIPTVSSAFLSFLLSLFYPLDLLNRAGRNAHGLEGCQIEVPVTGFPHPPKREGDMPGKRTMKSG